MKGFGEHQKKKQKETRLQIISTLSSEWRRFSELVQETGFSTSTLTRHLKALEAEESVERWVDTQSRTHPPPTYYRLKHPWTKHNPSATIMLKDLTRLTSEGIHTYRTRLYVDTQLEIDKGLLEAVDVNLRNIDDLFTITYATLAAEMRRVLVVKLLGNPVKAAEYLPLGNVVKSFIDRHQRSGVVDGVEAERVMAAENEYLRELGLRHEDVEELSGVGLEEMQYVLVGLNEEFIDSPLTVYGFGVYSGYRGRLEENEVFLRDLETLMKEHDPGVAVIACSDNVDIKASEAGAGMVP